MSGTAGFLELVDVSKSYGSGGDVGVLHGLNLRVARAESVAIVGPSGSGKTTLLNLIGTLDRPDAGRIRFDGEDLARLDDAALARLRARRIGFIFQFHHLLPHLTALENALVPALAAEDAALLDAAPARARRLLERVGLGHRLDHRPAELPGGERQRAAVVRALVNQPALLLADEPTGALDRASAANLATLLVELNREENVTLIVVTHAPDLARRMGRVCELRDGTLVEQRGT
ncbi:MAG TPA: ABC transporter ATP-binding protein [Verrucomicrobiota bacterium]|nr:ABC transporter ATP-binding protein [Verrucomicrobiota bacterium]